MATKAEVTTALLKGFGRLPTSYLLRWTPTWKHPIAFDLVEVMKCDADGETVSRKLAQSPHAVHHLGHQLKSPQRYGLWDVFRVQMRLI